MFKLFTVETHERDPIYVGGAAVVVRSRVVRIPLPFARGGFIWNRPLSVSVLRPGGAEQTLPVRDVTRLAQLALLVMGVAAGIVLGGVLRARGE